MPGMLNLLFLEGFPILSQLKLEEALLRADHQNWCLVNAGSPPAIVMGISNDPEHHVDADFCREHAIPLIRRYSGGGTVFIEETTLFVTWIFNQSSLNIPLFPKEVLRWTEPIVQSLLAPASLKVQENDYVIGNRKCGGNAQYFVKGRFVHHSSFLWDYSEKMRCLKLPPKMPLYRCQRSHSDFLYPLKNHFPSLEELLKTLKMRIQKLFPCRQSSLEEACKIQKNPHRVASSQSLLI
jgi:lipoate-protein ligase A